MNFIERFKFRTSDIENITTGFSYACSDCQDAHGFCCMHSAKAAYESGEVSEEGHFSHDRCDMCRSLPGNRYAAHGTIDGTSYHFEVCQDCLMYIANGELPEDEEE